MFESLTDVLMHRIHRYASIGLDGRPDKEKSKRYAFNILMLIGCLTAIGYATFYAIYDFEGLRIAWTASLVCSSVIFIPFVAAYSLRLALYLGVSLVVVVFTYLSYHLGTGTGLYLFMNLTLVGLFIAYGVDRPAETFAIWLVVTLAMVATVVLFEVPSGKAAMDPQLKQIIHIGVVIGVSAMMGASLLVLSLRVAQVEDQLAAEHARSETLLGNLLPKEIASQLKASPGSTIADDLPDVTVLFADIVDFTPRAAAMDAEEVVSFLNIVFAAFDRLTAQFGLEKVKTIGDAYMVAAGMPTPRPDHAEIMAEMALAILAEASRLSAEFKHPLQVRIGLHSGPAVAGVIGTQKVFYDVWGDTVNTASRLESHGVKGRIQVTQPTRDRLATEYDFEARDVIDIKGMGPTQTYWLVGKA